MNWSRSVAKTFGRLPLLDRRGGAKRRGGCSIHSNWNDHPVSAAAPQPPLLSRRGNRCQNQFIHTFYDRAYSSFLLDTFSASAIIQRTQSFHKFMICSCREREGVCRHGSALTCRSLQEHA